MTYKETLAWMYAQLPMYQRVGKTAFKKDLTNSIAFAKELANPEKKFKSIHVGGTNGKGSTSHMLASILQEAGYKVGLYTSPHLKNFTERIRINGKEIPKSKVSSFIKKQLVSLGKYNDTPPHEFTGAGVARACPRPPARSSPSGRSRGSRATPPSAGSPRWTGNGR